jgi:periplasmic protein TonB
MKNIIILAAVFVFAAGCIKNARASNPGSPDSLNKEEFKVEAEQMPSPVGGMAAIQEEIKYPAEAKEKNIQGKVFVEAYINEEGDVVFAEVTKSVNPLLDNAAINAIKEIKFIPAKDKENEVKIKIVIPIVFALN